MDLPSLVRDAAIVVAAYFIGGIPWGVLVARLAGGPDPRSLGSGRTGGANVLRAVGPRLALTAGLLDMLKGVVVVLLARLLGGGPWVEVAAATAAVIGHTFSPYLAFKGGRGVSVGWGALLVMAPFIAIAIIPVYLVVLLVTGYSSLGSLVGSLVAGVGLATTTLATGASPAYIAYAVVGTALIWLFHLDNIRRLLAGTERKLDLRRRERPPSP
jgi:acyl phosphate:glycerol-3-phosphate acyltransferase